MKKRVTRCVSLRRVKIALGVHSSRRQRRPSGDGGKSVRHEAREVSRDEPRVTQVDRVDPLVVRHLRRLDKGARLQRRFRIFPKFFSDSVRSRATGYTVTNDRITEFSR